VNNAGIACPGLSLDDLRASQLDEMIAVNLSAPIHLSRAAYVAMKSRKTGTIININSFMGIEERKNRSLYCSVRFGLRGFTRAFALEAEENGVRVFGVYPTRIKSRAEYTYGFEVAEVVERIMDFWHKGTGSELVLDGRQKPI
jgi:NAD(P)-dependent dehydrogenase (short-subunit alcohol dehydrogenase family)